MGKIPPNGQMKTVSTFWPRTRIFGYSTPCLRVGLDLRWFLRVTAYLSDLRVTRMFCRLPTADSRSGPWVQIVEEGKAKGRDEPGGTGHVARLWPGLSWTVGVNITIDGRIRQPTKRAKPIKMAFLANR